MTIRPVIEKRGLVKQGRLTADVADRGFFESHPDREYHARPSIPLEGDGWSASSHITRPVMLVARSIRGGKRFDRIAIGGVDDGVPDNEFFLSLLWRHIATMGSIGDGISITAETHRQLLEIAGLRTRS